MLSYGVSVGALIHAAKVSGPDKTVLKYCERVQFPNFMSATVSSRREFSSHRRRDETRQLRRVDVGGVH